MAFSPGYRPLHFRFGALSFDLVQTIKGDEMAKESMWEKKSTHWIFWILVVLFLFSFGTGIYSAFSSDQDSNPPSNS
jgi:hypothetical protein